MLRPLRIELPGAIDRARLPFLEQRRAMGVRTRDNLPSGFTATERRRYYFDSTRHEIRSRDAERCRDPDADRARRETGAVRSMTSEGSELTIDTGDRLR